MRTGVRSITAWSRHVSKTEAGERIGSQCTRVLIMLMRSALEGELQGASNFYQVVLSPQFSSTKTKRHSSKSILVAGIPYL